MTIKRIINGKPVEIKLTEYEMWDAYHEQGHEFDIEDVRHRLEEDGWELTDEQIDDAAYRARERMDENDYMSECRWDIIDDAIKEALK